MSHATLRLLVASLLIGISAGAASAQTTPPPATPAPASSSGTDRFFLAFAEEAALAESQWWEGQLEFSSFDAGGSTGSIDSNIARLVAAFQPWKRIEIGGRLGFGSTFISGSGPDGSGGTDLDLWGKYLFDQGDTDFAVGGLLTVPTGDDAVGLGHDAFDMGLFGSVRHRSANWIADGEAGVRFNGDGSFAGASYNGDVSVFIGGGVIIPTSDVFSIVGEARLETARADGADDDLRVLGGIHWRAGPGIVRAAGVIGLMDGSPDWQILGGYAWTF